MSTDDSFISEVTEEVRRDRLYALLRKNAWVIGAILLLVIGGTAANEWWKSSQRAVAEARGDTLQAALLAPTPTARIAALDAMVAGDAHILARLQLANAQIEAGDRSGAAANLQAIASDAAIDPVYRDLARLKLVTYQGSEMAMSERQAILAGLVAGGGPFGALALEQRALILLETGEKAAALAAFGQAYIDPGAPGALRRRAGQMITVLGGDPAEFAVASDN